jgi:hypothetical protein
MARSHRRYNSTDHVRIPNPRFNNSETTPQYAAFRLVKSLDCKHTVKLDIAISDCKKLRCLSTVLHKPC